VRLSQHLTQRLIGVWLLCASLTAMATTETDWVVLKESDDSLCLAHGGKLISLQLTAAALSEQAGDLEVWVDRWFMQVQTADHTRHVLNAQVSEAELGCSHTIAGPQHWTLSVIKRLPAAGNPSKDVP
jgi:hypothetical protein